MLGRLRLLILAPDCNPEGISIPFVSYCHAAALAELHNVTLVVRARAEGAVRRAKGGFQNIQVIPTPWLDRLEAWCIRNIFKNNFDSQLLTAFWYPISLAFEWSAWRKLRLDIHEGEFDVVLRLLPMSPSLASPFAFLLRNGPIPFVLGPLNGGLKSAPGFSQPDKQKWTFSFRKLYRLMPFAKATYQHATAIIAATSHMESEFAKYSEKLFFIPENGISRSLCAPDARNSPTKRLELIFVGGLVRRKACYLGLRAAAKVLREGFAHFTLIGDGPERKNLEELAVSLGVKNAISFCGWLGHAEVLKSLRIADVVVLPAIREGGGGVVFEALASGSVPVILDYGGPGDIVHPEVGYKVRPTSEEEVVSQMEQILCDLAGDRDLLGRLRKQGMSYASECLTWEAKAYSTTQVLNWAIQRGPKPDLPPTRMARVKCPS